MRVITVTLGAGATAIAPVGLQPDQIRPIQNLVFCAQSATAYVGDSAVSSTNGIELGSGDAVVIPVSRLQYSSDLSEWYLAGTEGDKVSVMVIE